MVGYLQKIQSKYKALLTTSISVFIFFSLLIGLKPDFLVNNAVYAADVDVIVAPSYTINPDGHLIASLPYTFSSSSSRVVAYYTANIPFVGIIETSLTGDSKNYEVTIFEKEFSTDVVFVLKDLAISGGSSRSVTFDFKVANYFDKSSSMLSFPLAYSKTLVDKATLTVDKSLSAARLATAQTGSTTQKDSSGNTQFIFSKPTAESTYLLFGQSTSYDFKISQKLENFSEQTQHFEIPLPRADKLQDVLITSSNAESVARKDLLGNMYIGVDLMPGQTINFEVIGELISYGPEGNSYTEPSLASSLVIDNQYWNLESNVTDILAEQLGLNLKIDQNKIKYSEPEYLARIQATQKFVVDRLSVAEKATQNSSGQDTGSVNLAIRTGAQKAYETRSVDAVNYADLTIALLRSQGIPARMVVGYIKPIAPNLKEGFIHSWVEAWSSDQGWIDIDPAYEEITKQTGVGISLNDHVPFIIRDINPIKPTMGVLEDKSITISFAKTSSSSVVEIESTLTAKKRDVYNQTVELELTFTNDGNAIISDAFIEIYGTKQPLLTDGELVLGGQTVKKNLIIELSADELLKKSTKLSYKLEFYSIDETVEKATGEIVIETVTPWWWNYLFISASVTIPLAIAYVVWLITKRLRGQSIWK